MKKKYHIEGIDCANCAAKVEKKMNDLPDVSVTLTFATSQLLVEAENPDEVLPKLREIADKMEPGTVIEEISRQRNTVEKRKLTITMTMKIVVMTTVAVTESMRNMSTTTIIMMTKIAVMVTVAATENMKDMNITTTNILMG